MGLHARTKIACFELMLAVRLSVRPEPTLEYISSNTTFGLPALAGLAWQDRLSTALHAQDMHEGAR